VTCHSAGVDSRRAQVARIRPLALAALREYPMPPGRLVFVSHGENTTFRLDGSYLVRVHRPQRHGRDADPSAAIRSELDWLVAIRADTDVEVPVPVSARDGRTVVETGGRMVSVLRWMAGRLHENTIRPVQLRRLGVVLATLHRHAAAWTPPAGFTRIRWDYETFFGDVMVYGGIPASGVWELLPADTRRAFDRVAERMAGRFDELCLVHADLHPGNVLFHQGRARPIDFDDCGFAPLRYDVGVALWELRHRPDYDAYRAAFLAGYRSVRPLEPDGIDDFIALREVAFGLWYAGNAQVDPEFRAGFEATLASCARSVDRLLP
jgi:Ser/Thr protein kinase RdoA (MazF antagonist)